MSFSNPFRDPYTGHARCLPVDLQTAMGIVFLAIIAFMGCSQLVMLNRAERDCLRRDGVLIVDIFGRPNCVSAPPRR